MARHCLLNARRQSSFAIGQSVPTRGRQRAAVAALRLVLLTALALLSTPAQSGLVVSLAVPRESQDVGNNDGYASRDEIWSVSAPPFPFDTSSGVGHLIDTSAAILAVDTNPLTRFGVLHSHVYASPYVPVTSATVTYGFDSPTRVNGLEIVQHMNGVTRVEGFIGNSLSAMVSIGNVFGPNGDVRGAGVFTEGESTMFGFSNATAALYFQFRITQTSLDYAYAVHRAFPIGQSSQRITGALSAVPEIDPAGMGSVLALVTGALGLLERRRLKAS